MIQIKRYNDGQDAVGEWYFELDEVGILPKNQDSLRLVLSMALRLADSLAVDGFFQFTHLRIDYWHCASADSGEYRMVDKHLDFQASELRSMLDNPAPITLVPNEENTFWFPSNAVMEGITKIALPQQELLLPQAFSVRVSFAGIFAFTLVTDCDAWLSHDLKGHEQTETMELNLPRLEKALEAATDVLGVEAYVENTEYAHMLEGSIASLHEEEGHYRIIDEPERWVLQEWES